MLSTWKPPINNISTAQFCLVSIVVYLGDNQAATKKVMLWTIYKFYCDSGPYDIILIYDDIYN